MTAIPNKFSFRESRRAKRNYFPRIFGLALGGLCVGTVIFATPQAETWVWVLLLANALAWPHLAYLRTLHAANPRQAETLNLLFDSMMGGFWLAAMQGNLFPSMLIFTMLMMNNMLIGGWRLLQQGALAHLVGALLGLGIFGWEFRPESSFVVQIVCLVFLMVYSAIIGRVTFLYTQQLKQRVEVLELSENDILSSLPNRHFFETKLAAEFGNFKRNPHPAALVVADIDYVENRYSLDDRSYQDATIRKLGQVFRDRVRSTDTSARLGTERFAVLMPHADVEEAQQLTLRLQSCFAEAIAADPHLSGATLNFGIATPQPDMPSYEAWLKQADQALSLAKSSERDSAEAAEEK